MKGAVSAFKAISGLSAPGGGEGDDFLYAPSKGEESFPYQVCALKNPTAASYTVLGVESGEKDERLLLKVTLGLGFLPLPFAETPCPSPG